MGAGSERLRVTFEFDVEPTVDSSAMEIVTGACLSLLSEGVVFPDRWTVEIVPGAAS